jgi:hypothetical protein
MILDASVNSTVFWVKVNLTNDERGIFAVGDTTSHGDQQSEQRSVALCSTQSLNHNSPL